MTEMTRFPRHCYSVIERCVNMVFSEVVEKFMPVADFCISADDMCQKNNFLKVVMYVSETLDIFGDTVYLGPSCKLYRVFRKKVAPKKFLGIFSFRSRLCNGLGRCTYVA